MLRRPTLPALMLLAHLGVPASASADAQTPVTIAVDGTALGAPVERRRARAQMGLDEPLY